MGPGRRGGSRRNRNAKPPTIRRRNAEGVPLPPIEVGIKSRKRSTHSPGKLRAEIKTSGPIVKSKPPVKPAITASSEAEVNRA